MSTWVQPKKKLISLSQYSIVDNENIKFDYSRRQYVLTDQGFKTKTGKDVMDKFKTKVERDGFYDRISDRLYAIIYSMIPIPNDSRAVHEYRMSRDPELIKGIMAALVSYADAAYETDIDMFADQALISSERFMGSRTSLENVDIPADLRRILQGYELIYTHPKGYYVTSTELEAAYENTKSSTV